jgi:glucan-binding YG repeat protein
MSNAGGQQKIEEIWYYVGRDSVPTKVGWQNQATQNIV